MADSVETSSGESLCGDEIKWIPTSTIRLADSPGSVKLEDAEPRRMNQKVKRRRPNTEESADETKSRPQFDVVEVGRAHFGGRYFDDQFSRRRGAARGGFSFNSTGVESVPSEQKREYIKQKLVCLWFQDQANYQSINTGSLDTFSTRAVCLLYTSGANIGSSCHKKSHKNRPGIQFSGPFFCRLLSSIRGSI